MSIIGNRLKEIYDSIMETEEDPFEVDVSLTLFLFDVCEILETTGHPGITEEVFGSAFTQAIKDYVGIE